MTLLDTTMFDKLTKYLFARRLYKSIKKGEGELIPLELRDYLYFKDGYCYYLSNYYDCSFIKVYKLNGFEFDKENISTPKGWESFEGGVEPITNIEISIKFRDHHPKTIQDMEDVRKARIRNKEILDILKKLP